MDKVQVGSGWGRAKGLPWAGIVISVVCLALVVLRNLFPGIFHMDAVSIGLLILAVAPWIRSAIKSIEVTGIGKIELNDVEKAAKKVEESDLPGLEDVGSAAPIEVTDPEPSETSSPEGSTAIESAPNYGAIPIAETHSPTQSFYKWAGHSLNFGGKIGYRPLLALAALEIQTSELAAESRTQAQLGSVRDLMLKALRYLCQVNEIPPLGLSVSGMLNRLKSKSVLTRNQGDGILAAMEMVNEVMHTSATPEAAQRTLDVAKEVIGSLDVIIRRTEIERMIRVKTGLGTSPADDQAQ
ncbi:hypothetical protein I5U25_02675 [Stenotrophomonas maltophilia]|nr:hypothetical protein [Stenotrophomonas maltophilia]